VAQAQETATAAEATSATVVLTAETST
jgi:hypothetical protein